MFKNYLITAIRNLFRNKLYALINIGGLAVGLAACILIVLFVVEEKTHDNFWDNKENIYRLEGIVSLKGREPRPSPSFTAASKDALLSDFPEIKDITRFTSFPIPVRQGDARFNETVIFTDPNLFEMLSFEFIEGTPETALIEPRSVVLSETMAQKYFGDQPALGQTMFINANGEFTYKVSGVVKDLPTNTHVDFQMAIPIVLSDFDNPDGSTNPLEYWGSFSVFILLELFPGADPAAMQDNMPAFLDRHVPESIQNIVNMSGSELFQTRLVNITDMHLEGTPGGMLPRGDNATIAAFITIAILILAIAGINFMNLATVQSMKRSKEVAVRKAVGARRSNIMSQFLGETVGLCFLALLVSIALVQIALPWYNEISSKFLEMRLFSDPATLMGLAAFTIVVGLGAGAYPAFMLAAFRPSEILQGSSGQSGGSTWLRKTLVVVQFSISIGLIIATAVILTQIRYAKTMDMGFDKENILVIRSGSQADYPALSPALIADLKRLPEVIDATRSTNVPGDGGFSETAVQVAGQDNVDRIPIGRFAVDYGFFETYGIAPLVGRTFSENFGTDIWVQFGIEQRSPNSTVILNESGMKRLGFSTPEQAVGQVILSGPPDNVSNLVIVGVVPDFNFQSARVDVRPEMYFIDQGNLFPISVRFQTDTPGEFLAAVEQIWNRHFPDEIFVTQFVDENLATLYAQDEARGYLIGAFSLLAIFVSSLGLFGLAALTTERRTKEIGVRKVMGASVFRIVRLITWQFSKPVVVANAIAWPVAWYFMAQWLDGFVYRIDLSIMFFIFAGVVAIGIAWMTVAGHAWAVARTTPVKALRYE